MRVFRCYGTHLNDHKRQEKVLDRSRRDRCHESIVLTSTIAFQLRIELSFCVLPLHAGCHHSVSMCSSAPLALVPHIPTPPLHDRGSYRHSTQALTATSGWRLGGAEARGVVNQYVCLGDLRVSQCVPLTRADQGLLWGSSGLQNRRERDFPTDLRI